MKKLKVVGAVILGAAAVLSFAGCKHEASREETNVITKLSVTELKPVLDVSVNSDVSAVGVRTVSNARTVLKNSARAAEAAGDMDFTLSAADSLIAVKSDGSTEAFMKAKTGASDDSKFEVTYEVETKITYEDGSTKIKKGKKITKTVTAAELLASVSSDSSETEADAEAAETYEVSDEMETSAEDVSELIEEVAAEEDEVVMPAVLETYQCRYTNSIDSEARGLYIVYAGCSTNGKVSQLSYVYPDGEVFDVLNYDGNFSGEYGANRGLELDAKSGTASEGSAAMNGGNNYILFDKRGNMYAMVYDWSSTNPGDQGRVIYKFNPVSKKVTAIRTGNTEKDIFYKGFAVDDEGTNVFTTEEECDKDSFADDKYDGYTTANAYRLVDGSDPVKTELYRTSVKEHSMAVPVYFDGKLYFIVSDYNNNYRDTGLYIASPDKDANYTKANVAAYKNPTQWTIVDLYLMDNYKSNGNKFDYNAILEYFRDNYCTTSDAEFRLDRLYDTKEEYIENGRGDLYTDKTNVEALKYLLEDGTDNFIGLLESSYAKWDVDGNGSEDIFHKFVCYMWENGGRFPFEKLMFKKDSKETAYSVPEEYYSTTFGSMVLAGEKLIASEDGVFFIHEYNQSNQSYEYLEVYQICDADGKFIGEMPESLNPNTIQIHKNLNTNTKVLTQSDTTTWYKNPIQETEKGIVMISSDKKTLYYYYNGVTKNILINDSSYGALDEILTFDATAESVCYNGKSGTKYVTKKIDLSDFSVVTVDYDDQLGSIMEFHDSGLKTTANDAVEAFTVTLADNPAITITPITDNSKLTLKVTNFTEKAGYTVTWECMGHVLVTSDTLVMNLADYSAGNYPITVTASKDGVIYSDFMYVRITK